MRCIKRFELAIIYLIPQRLVDQIRVEQFFSPPTHTKKGGKNFKLGVHTGIVWQQNQTLLGCGIQPVEQNKSEKKKGPSANSFQTCQIPVML